MIIELADHALARGRWPGDRTEPPVSVWSGDAREVEKRIHGWLVAWVAGRLAIPAGEVVPSLPYECYGFGSIEVTALAVALERWLGRRLPRSVLAAHPTIDALARYACRAERW
jgi:acyl carrier protein